MRTVSTVTHVSKAVSLPPGLSEHSLECPQGFAGVVASYRLGAGGLVGGIAPNEPASCVLLLNVGSQATDALLVCRAPRGLGAGDPVAVVPVANTATADTTSLDPNAANDGASVVIGVRGAVTPPGPGTGPTGPTRRACGPGRGRGSDDARPR